VGLVLTRSALTLAISFVGALLDPSQAFAHDHWISSERFRDPASGSWCCDENDCFPIDDKEVQATAGGFLIDRQHFVSRKRVLPSNDGLFWACFNGNAKGPHEKKEKIRCFFAPLNM